MSSKLSISKLHRLTNGERWDEAEFLAVFRAFPILVELADAALCLLKNVETPLEYNEITSQFSCIACEATSPTTSEFYHINCPWVRMCGASQKVMNE